MLLTFKFFVFLLLLVFKVSVFQCYVLRLCPWTDVSFCDFLLPCQNCRCIRLLFVLLVFEPIHITAKLRTCSSFREIKRIIYGTFDFTRYTGSLIDGQTDTELRAYVTRLRVHARIMNDVCNCRFLKLFCSDESVQGLKLGSSSEAFLLLFEYTSLTRLFFRGATGECRP